MQEGGEALSGIFYQVFTQNSLRKIVFDLVLFQESDFI